jgi:diguanylate cyclase (GGDEF)-like protein
VARVGGDEFVIVIRHYKRDPVVFDRILNALAGPIELDASQATVEVRGSLGVSLFEPTTPLNGDQLLRQADQAAYRVKSRGGHDYRFFSGPDTE